jgi:DNA-binding response OmpR family regulator
MNYKIVSNNQKLIEKASHVFSSLNMKESIHIQEVDFWLVDVKTIDAKVTISYKSRMNYSNILFVVNSDEDIKLSLDNSFLHYIKDTFSDKELSFWCEYFLKNKKEKLIKLDENTLINLDKSSISQNEKTIALTLQEKALLNELCSVKYTPTKLLANSLKLQSPTSIRTIINRIRKKLDYDIFEQKKGFGYKLKSIEIAETKVIKSSAMKELQEQNYLMQNVIDSSPIFIVTFIHKQLYCINKSFRDYLGNEIVKELWDEEKGDFFALIEHNTNETKQLKEKLFSKGKYKINLYETNNNDTSFEIETFYFENLDKHLFIFKSKKS